MAERAAPSVTVANALALRRQAGQTRLAAGGTRIAARQTIRRAVGIHAQATKQHAELVRARRSPQARGSDHGQPAGSSLARRQPEGSLASIRRQVRAIHHQFQFARQAGTRPGAGHLRLVPPPEWPPPSPASGGR